MEPPEYDDVEPSEVTPAEDPLIEVSPTFEDRIEDGETGWLLLEEDVPPDVEADPEETVAAVADDAAVADAAADVEREPAAEPDAAPDGALELWCRAARCCEREPGAESARVPADTVREESGVAVAADPVQDSVADCPASKSPMSGSAWSPQRSTRLVMPR